MVLGSGKVSSYNLFTDSVNTDTDCPKEAKLLGIIIDNQLKSKKHIEDLFKKASFKLHAVKRLRSYLTFDKASAREIII